LSHVSGQVHNCFGNDARRPARQPAAVRRLHARLRMA